MRLRRSWRSQSGRDGLAGCNEIATLFGQPVLLLIASLLMAPEPFGEVRRGTVVRPDYGDYCCVEFPPSVFASRVVVTTSSRTEFPTVRLLSSGRARAGRRRRGGSRSPRSQQWFPFFSVRLLSSGRARAGWRRRGGNRSLRSLQWFPFFSVHHPRGMPLRDLFFPCLLLVLACVRWDCT
ncbi:hypothetical protein Taro_009119 [Colocasia esculenta]|uniref:Uncharacterized protein n=1 Tax=Colocasia esculenta TaxID=4460 RepID=A0A843U352_COLES|nr:hypothetical protein [Colocasia esculenta]